MTKKVEQIMDPSSSIYKRIAYHHKFKKRTFKLHQTSETNLDNTENSKDLIDLDEVKLKLQERCSHCKGQLLAP